MGNDKVRRQETILRYVAQDGRVAVESLAEEFGVSVMTIRRDLAHLSASGQLNRIHGGALPTRSGVIAFSFREKVDHMAAQKRTIAQHIAEMVEPGMAISLDTGTTTLAVAQALVTMENIRVITTSLAIASALHTLEGIELILLGGVVRKHSPDLWGAVTEENIRRFHVNLAVLGTDAITPSGAFTTDVGISRVSRAFIENADRAVMVADSSKFSASAFVQHASFSELDVLVTDDHCPLEARRWLEKAVPDVVYAKTTGELL